MKSINNIRKALETTVLASALVAGGNAVAQEAKEAKPLVHDAYVHTGWHSKYLGSYGFSITETPVVQSDVGFSVGRFNYDMWSNYNTRRQKVDEIDHTLSTSFSLSDHLNLGASVVYFNSPTSDWGDAIEVGLRLSTKNLPVDVSLFGANIFGKGITPGQALDLKVAKAFPITDRLSVGLEGNVWFNNGYWVAPNESGFSHANAKASLNVDLGKGFSTSVYGKVQKGLESLGGVFKDNSSYGITVTKSF